MDERECFLDKDKEFKVKKKNKKDIISLFVKKSNCFDYNSSNKQYTCTRCSEVIKSKNNTRNLILHYFNCSKNVQPITCISNIDFNIGLTKCLIESNIPLEKVNNKSFNNFFKNLGYDLQCPNTLRSYIPQIYDKIKDKVKDNLKQNVINENLIDKKYNNSVGILYDEYDDIFGNSILDVMGKSLINPESPILLLGSVVFQSKDGECISNGIKS